MEISTVSAGKQKEIINLFEATFAASEGEEQGKLIGKLVKDLLNTTSGDLLTFLAWNGADLMGGICFSRFRFQNDDRIAYMLSPVAVRPGAQRQGLGQTLLNHGLNDLRNRKVDIAITYGDPNYYCRVGFEQITEEIIPSPHRLSQPHGWMAQSLNGKPIDPVQGTTSCVEAFNDPTYW